MQIFVRNLPINGKLFALEVKPTDIVAILKAKIMVRTDVFTAVFDIITFIYIYILGQGRNTILQAEIGVFRNESGGWGKSLRVQHPEGKHYQSAATLGQPQSRGHSPDPTGEGEGL